MGSCLSKDSEHIPQPVKSQSQNISRTTKPKSFTKSDSKGQTLSNNSSTQQNNEKLPPGEAARLAAESRLNSSKAKNGQLGEKLDKERSKSNQLRLKELSEKKIRDEKLQKLVYD
ncbi:hypothetical protein WICMUC_004459 [Wickerhamomyces mucosus]|uniref:Uncharacterized protein n=1 Tax=Wickerhamomyces mucosus TaxID=1378264 RepID=A0A9P8PGV5_9ASCO|nr:hypothetical protein WICMUC_004459 [Wickerhamomyces mucosus]